MNNAPKLGKAVRSPIAVKDELVRLAGLDRETCLAEWRRSFPVANAKHLSIQFLRKALAHEAQISAFGDVNPLAARSLLAIGKGNAPSKALQTRLKPGSRLLREWNGRTHEIEVVPDGFVWKGQRYRSLTAIARAITGTNWSGPRFFGLNR